MKLKSPQPNQSFFGLKNSGRSYTSNAACFIYPLDAADANELRAHGCVDVADAVHTTQVAESAKASPDAEISGAMHGLSPQGQEHAEEGVKKP